MADFFKRLFGNDKTAKKEPVDKDGEGMNEMPTKNESVEKEEEAKHNQEVEVEKEESELPRPDSTKEETMATGTWALNGNELVDMDRNHVAYADKESSHAALFLNQHLLVYENNYIILDDITRIYHYKRSYSGDGTTEITDKTILVTDGKKKVYDNSYEKYAGPSWDDYADVMESDDKEEFYIETQDRKYKVEFDYKVWGWLLEYFPSKEENK